MAAASGAATALAILAVLGNARRLGLVQTPDARSSHVRPTPTGGGIGIALGSTFAGLFALAGNSQVVATVLVVSLGFAVLGLWDDIRPLPALARLAGHLLLVTAAIAMLLPLHELGAIVGRGFPDALVGAGLVLLTAYWVNLYNFMDGIDGIAGSEAAFLLLAPLAIAVAHLSAAAGSSLFWWPAAVAAAVLVFLVFNWQPARIFMGDAGSTFLGFMIAAFAMREIAAGWLSPWSAAILPACFVTDGTLTLLHRIARREPILRPHRRHAYQRLARRFSSHQRVVVAFAALNLAWLLPLAVAAQLAPSIAPLLTALAYAPLMVLALVAGAGSPEHA